MFFILERIDQRTLAQALRALASNPVMKATSHTTGAMAGGLAGLTVGEAGIPAEWIEGIAEWPRSIVKIKEMADALARKACGEKVFSPIKYFWPGVAARNVVFLAIVLLHGFRRLFPPY